MNVSCQLDTLKHRCQFALIMFLMQTRAFVQGQLLSQLSFEMQTCTSVLPPRVLQAASAAVCQLGQHLVTGSKRHIGQRVSPVANHSCIHLGWNRCPHPTLRSCSCMTKLSRQMLHSVCASPLSLLAGWFVGRSCEAFSVYATRRRSDMMLGPVRAHRQVTRSFACTGKASWLHQQAHPRSSCWR